MTITYQGDQIEIKPFPGKQYFVAHGGRSCWFVIDGTKWVKTSGTMSEAVLQKIKKAAAEQH